jgi:hypothetical protein
MKKGVGSGVGSGSISERYGSGDPDPVRTKMSRIPNTAFYTGMQRVREGKTMTTKS